MGATPFFAVGRHGDCITPKTMYVPAGGSSKPSDLGGKKSRIKATEQESKHQRARLTQNIESPHNGRGTLPSTKKKTVRDSLAATYWEGETESGRGSRTGPTVQEKYTMQSMRRPNAATYVRVINVWKQQTRIGRKMRWTKRHVL